MIVDRLDLDTAVAEGIITREQALRLRDLSTRDLAKDDSRLDFSQDIRDEPFRLLRGFRDVFIAIGVVIFATGVSITLMSRFMDLIFGVGNHRTFGEISAWGILLAAILCAIGFGLAEIITRRYRLPLSSLVISICFAGWWGFLFGLVAAKFLGRSPYLSAEEAVTVIVSATIAGSLTGVAVFYWRYRLPFALLLIAGSMVGLSILLVREAMGTAWFLDHGRMVFGLWGLAVFAGAMWFDINDRLRITRFSECAFWLHLFAAPMLVHALLAGEMFRVPDTAVVLGTMSVLALIALFIDRRALLVSGLIYLAATISNLISTSPHLADQEISATAFILGVLMLVLGLGWTAIRKKALMILPERKIKSLLPPTA